MKQLCAVLITLLCVPVFAQTKEEKHKVVGTVSIMTTTDIITAELIREQLEAGYIQRMNESTGLTFSKRVPPNMRLENCFVLTTQGNSVRVSGQTLVMVTDFVGTESEFVNPRPSKRVRDAMQNYLDKLKAKLTTH